MKKDKFYIICPKCGCKDVFISWAATMICRDCGYEEIREEKKGEEK